MTDSFQDLHADLPVRWPDGRTYRVRQFRCLGCGALDLIQRDTAKANEKHEPQEGHYAPGDGLRMTVEPIHESG